MPQPDHDERPPGPPTEALQEAFAALREIASGEADTLIVRYDRERSRWHVSTHDERKYSRVVV